MVDPQIDGAPMEDQCLRKLARQFERSEPVRAGNVDHLHSDRPTGLGLLQGAEVTDPAAHDVERIAVRVENARGRTVERAVMAYAEGVRKLMLEQRRARREAHGSTMKCVAPEVDVAARRDVDD